ncbi:hypothetical protein [Enterococcus rotai]|uniref:hypothetical protein n=1 Tax=Enterococcus rotai TaxID=118060 RepID=UPI0032B5D771
MMNKKKRIVFLLGCIAILCLVYKQANTSLVKAEHKETNNLTKERKRDLSDSEKKAVQGPEKKTNSRKRKDPFLEILESDEWEIGLNDGQDNEMFREKSYVFVTNEAKQLHVSTGFGSDLFNPFVETGNPSGNKDDPQYYKGGEMKNSLELMYSDVNNQSTVFGLIEPRKDDWTKDRLLNSSPLILSQTNDSGTKIIDALSINGHGNLSDTKNQPSIIENLRNYGIKKNIFDQDMRYTKMVYEVRNNPAVKSANMFDYHLRVETLTGMDNNGATIMGTKVTNISPTILPGLSLGGKYHIDMKRVINGGSSESTEQIEPVRFLDSNRGLVFTSTNQEKHASIQVRFYLDTPSKPQSWSAGQLNDSGHLEQFYDAKYSGFTGPASSGQEKNNAGFDAIAYSDEMRQSNGIKDSYKTAMYVKNNPTDLAPGESTFYSYRVLSSLLISETPDIALDEDEDSYFGGSHTITGTTMHYNEKSKNIEILYALKPEGPFVSGDLVKNSTPGSDIPWSIEIPESALKLQNQKIYIKAVAKDLGDKESDTLVQDLIYNAPPVVKISDQKNWFINGLKYNISGTWTEEEKETVSLYYSLDDSLPKIISKNLPNPGGAQLFSQDIPASDLGNESHTISVWAEDVRGGLSKEVTWTISPHNMPDLSANLAIDKTEIDEGQSVLFTSTFKNSAADPSVWDNVIYETTEAFPENVVVDTSTVKLNDQTISGNVAFEQGKLSVALGKIDPMKEMRLTYTVASKIENPPIMAPIKVEQAYKVSGITADGTKKEQISDKKTFKVKPRIAPVEVLYLEAGSDEVLHPKLSLSGQIGQPTEQLQLEAIEGYELTQVFFDDQEQLPLPDKPFTVNYGAVKQVKFYYEGGLRFKAVPDAFDFGTHAGSVDAKRFKPQMEGQKLIVSDTRRGKSGWTLKAKIMEPLKNAEGEVMTDVIKYNNGSKEELTLNGADITIFQHKESAKHEYDITKENWQKNDEGFLLDIKAGDLKSLGKYQGKLQITLEDAK